MNLIDKTLFEYINEVDSNTPTPGGGSVAALAGALGVALAKMLAHFSLNKNKFKEAPVRKQNQFLVAFDELSRYREVLVQGVDEDAISYEAVSMAFKSRNPEEIQRALNASAMIALEIQQGAFNALKYVSKLIELGNKNLYSDLISSAILLDSCVEMSSLNVVANATMLTDENIKNDYLTQTNQMVKKSKSMKNKIIKTINNL